MNSMTPDALEERLSSRTDLPTTHNSKALLVAVEGLADAHPADREIASLLRALHGQMTAPSGLRPVVEGIRRGRLIRWDDISTTWMAHQVSDGAEGQLRVMRRRQRAADDTQRLTQAPTGGVRRSARPDRDCLRMCDAKANVVYGIRGVDMSKPVV